MKKTSYEISYDVITSIGERKMKMLMESSNCRIKNTFLYVTGLVDTVMVKWRPLLLWRP